MKPHIWTKFRSHKVVSLVWDQCLAKDHLVQPNQYLASNPKINLSNLLIILSQRNQVVKNHRKTLKMRRPEKEVLQITNETQKLRTFTTYLNKRRLQPSWLPPKHLQGQRENSKHRPRLRPRKNSELLILLNILTVFLIILLVIHFSFN